MKNALIQSIVFLFLFTSCKQSGNFIKDSSYTFEKAKVSKMIAKALSCGNFKFTENISKVSAGALVFNERNFVYSLFHELAGPESEKRQTAALSVAENYNFRNLSILQHTNRVQEFDPIHFSLIFNEQQIYFIRPYLDSVLAEHDYNRIKEISVTYEGTILTSSLASEEKVLLITLSRSIISLVEYLENGTYTEISNALQLVYEGNTRSGFQIQSRCTINVRNVMLGAVVGFFSGGALGLKAGCLGGTVVIPGIGTATGCVGGAVFGAATGFVSGAVSGIAAELLGSCFR
ncbi:MAG TPA: hypothetical protein PKE63_04600 [Lacibacter sp.]|nr:hypothetical protein [Lacibacter sp.]HMO90099.1 hypothetical protein [Lacibacter sp.]HMP86532.1 hypothetical protein [Lacibacter sp.]